MEFLKMVRCPPTHGQSGLCVQLISCTIRTLNIVPVFFSSAFAWVELLAPVSLMFRNVLLHFDSLPFGESESMSFARMRWALLHVRWHLTTSKYSSPNTNPHLPIHMLWALVFLHLSWHLKIEHDCFTRMVGVWSCWSANTWFTSRPKVL